MSVHVYDTPGDLAAGAADLIESYISNTGHDMILGLAGGGTPAATYAQLATRDVDWSAVTMWLSDERWVPHDHPDSNTRMARETLVDKVVGRLLAPDTAFGDPQDAATAYSRKLEATFRDGRSDIILLGIGDDGHTASLFPDTEALESDESAYLSNWVDAKEVWRLTASMPMLWNARELVFLVQGEGKAAVLAQIIDEGVPYPAHQVAAGATSVSWLVDVAAASYLRSIPS